MLNFEYQIMIPLITILKLEVYLEPAQNLSFLEKASSRMFDMVLNTFYKYQTLQTCAKKYRHELIHIGRACRSMLTVNSARK